MHSIATLTFRLCLKTAAQGLTSCHKSLTGNPTRTFCTYLSTDFVDYAPSASLLRAALQDARALTAYQVVVDVDLEKFFDRVNHDVLMEPLSKRIDDKAVLRLIHRYLMAGIMYGGEAAL